MNGLRTQITQTVHSQSQGSVTPLREFFLSPCESEDDCSGVEMYTEDYSAFAFPYMCKRFVWGTAAPQEKSGSSAHVFSSNGIQTFLPSWSLVCARTIWSHGCFFHTPQEPTLSNGYCDTAWVKSALQCCIAQRAAGVQYLRPALPYSGWSYCEDCSDGPGTFSCIDDEDPSEALACDDKLQGCPSSGQSSVVSAT